MERWIWTELLAFDRDAPDRGVGGYLDTTGFVPDGISVLLSAIDFVLLHGSFDSEQELFPDVCSRTGHAGNENRMRQPWRCGELRDLIAGLRKHGIKVFFSVFPYELDNRFHTEFASLHPECRPVSAASGVTHAVQLLARLNDGRYLEEIFCERLRQVMLDYGFDGFHGADGMGPGGMSLATVDFSDGMCRQFMEYLGGTEHPELTVAADHDAGRLRERADFIWRNLWPEWYGFYCSRWKGCWERIASTLKAIGKESMVNSPNTRGGFDGIYQYGIDYRDLARAGVDYLLVETVAAGFRLLCGGRDFQFDFAAQLLEFRAMMPQTKLLFLHGAKDVVESYDLIRHAPAWIERDFCFQSMLYQHHGEPELRRAADGFMECLGDGLNRAEWAFLREQWDLAETFPEVRQAGDFVWLWSGAAIDGLKRAYPETGMWPGFEMIGHLTGHYDFAIQTVAGFEKMSTLSGHLIVPNAELLSEPEWNALAAYRNGAVLLLGNLPEWKLHDGFVIRCEKGTMKALLRGCDCGECVIADEAAPFQARIPDWNYHIAPERMEIPERFWQEVAARLAPLRDQTLVCGQPGLRRLFLRNEAGRYRFGLHSGVPGYIPIRAEWTSRATHIRKYSKFPYTEMSLDNGQIVAANRHSPLHVPPYGIVIFECTPIDATRGK